MAATALKAGQLALLSYLEVGRLLTIKKAEVGEGNYLAWLAENCPEISRSQASRYTRIYEHRSKLELENGDGARVHHGFVIRPDATSLRSALAIIAEEEAEELAAQQGEQTEQDSTSKPKSPWAKSKLSTVFDKILKVAEDTKLAKEEEVTLLDYWKQLGERLQKRGLLTDDFRPAQQLDA